MGNERDLKIPYAELSEEKVLGKICVGERETIPETCILGHKAIIERCWSLVPKERPSAQAVQNAIQNTDQLVEKGMLLSSLLGLKDVNQQVKTFLIESIVKDFFPAK